MRALAAVATVVAVLMLAPDAASAHDELVSSSPRNGAHVKTMPGVLILNFEEPPVTGYTKVRLTGPLGRDAGRGAPVTAGAHVSLAVAQTGKLAPGRYTITWSVLSDDGHPVAGTIRFTLDPAAAPPPVLAAGTTADGGEGAGLGWLLASLGGLGLLGLLFAATRELRHRSS
jgi:methionine-rich copper-binding protein CopC